MIWPDALLQTKIHSRRVLIWFDSALVLNLFHIRGTLLVSINFTMARKIKKIKVSKIFSEPLSKLCKISLKKEVIERTKKAV